MNQAHYNVWYRKQGYPKTMIFKANVAPVTRDVANHIQASICNLVSTDIYNISILAEGLNPNLRSVA